MRKVRQGLCCPRDANAFYSVIPFGRRKDQGNLLIDAPENSASFCQCVKEAFYPLTARMDFCIKYFTCIYIDYNQESISALRQTIYGFIAFLVI